LRLLQTYLRPWRKFATFRGRATRREFWTFLITNALLLFALRYIDRMLGSHLGWSHEGVLTTLFLVIEFLPSTAVHVRRLHDSGLSAWWLLTLAVPIIGVLVLWGLMLRASQSGDNRYGPATVPELTAIIPPDGGPPFAEPSGRFVRCPWCHLSNPSGRESCQWCHKPYRDPTGDVAA